MEAQLDLSSVAGHAAAVEWIRNNVVLRSEETAGILKLTVSLEPNGHAVTLFMNAADHYIMGFQGLDKIYLLRDDHRDEFKKLLISRKFAAADQVDDELVLGADHNSLRTLQERFTRADLVGAARLARFSRSKSNSEEVRRPLSLLICMIAECARLRSMEWTFRGIYENLDRPVRADEAIQSWKDAVDIVRLANKHFPTYPRVYAVEKLAKRAAELRTLWDQIVLAVGPFANEKAAKQQVIDGVPALGRWGAVAYQVQRFADMSGELSVDGRKATAEEISFIMTACQNETALYAAREGVTDPPLSQSARARGSAL